MRSGISNRLLLFFVLLGICGLAIFAVKHKSVFPSAAINLSVCKADILKIAEVWNAKLGYKKEKVIKSITFGCDDDVKTFLEYELGNEIANQLMQKQVPVFYWYCAYKKEFDQEKMLMTISPEGELLFFDHVFPNDQAIEDIGHEEAKAKAFAFVLKQTGWSEADCKLVEDNIDKQVHRIDHDFIWENEKTDWKGAKLRVSASYSGSILSGYYKFLKLPETWDRRYQTIRSYNNLLQTIATIFYSLLHLVALFIFFRAITSGQIRWRFVLTCAAILTAICFLDNLNDLASDLSSYDPHKSYSAFLCITAFGLVASLPFSFIGIAVVVGAAAQVYRWAFPQHLPWQKWFSWNALRSKYVTTGIILGYATFGISIGYQICYYALGQKLHFWCPLGVDKYEILTAAQPWFSAFTLGVFASGAEELLYRVIMLGLGQKFLKRFWLANILQAMAWGFMHSSYPQQPAYARGVELTIEGMFWGWIIRRYGLLPCLVSHYLFDVFCDSVPLLSAKMLGLKLSVFIPLLPFLVLSIIGAWLGHKKGGAPEDDFSAASAQSDLNDEASTDAKTLVATLPKSSATQNSTDDFPYTYNPLAKATRWVLASAIFICLIIGLIWQEPKYEIYQNSPPLEVNRFAAIKIARDYLVTNHFDLKDYMAVATCENGLLNHRENFQYIYEKLGFEKTDKIAHQIEHPHIWKVRYFKPGSAEEYMVSVDANGTVMAQTITKEEDAGGAKLTEAEARKIAEDYLAKSRKVYEPLVFRDMQVNNRAHRLDYSFQFKSPKYKAADADLIVAVDVLGDVPSYEGHYWNIPDEWKWSKARITLAKALAMIVMAIIALACFLAFIWWMVSLFIAKAVRWRAVVPALIFMVLTSLLLLNFIPSGFALYQTTVPLPTYITMLIIGSLLMTLFTAASMVFGLVLGTAAIDQLQLKQQVTLSLRNLVPWLAPDKKLSFNFWLDAMLMAGAYGLFSHLYNLAELTIGQNFSHSVSMESLTIFHSAINSFSPTATDVSMVLTSLFSSVMFLSIFIAMLKKFGIKKDWQILLLIFAVSALSCVISIFSATTDFHWQGSLFYFVYGIINALLYWFFLRKAVLRNVLSLFIWLFCAQIFAALKELAQCGWPLFSTSIFFMSVVAWLPVGYLIYLAAKVIKQRLAT